MAAALRVMTAGIQSYGMGKVGGGILILVWGVILVTAIILRTSVFAYTDGDGAVRGAVLEWCGGVG